MFSVSQMFLLITDLNPSSGGDELFLPWAVLWTADGQWVGGAGVWCEY